MSADNVFCIGNDIIHYFESFEDEERDYYGITFAEKQLSNGVLSEIKKRPNPTGIEIRYTHDPSVYRSPVSKSGLDGTWYDATIAWDGENNKWRISSAMLFKEPADDKRGEWKLELKVKDNTTKPIFDKESIGSAIFRVHTAPVPIFTFTEGTTTASLSDAGSYDIDGSYKGLQGNYATDKGIKQWYWSAKIGDNWIDVGTGKSVTFNKNGSAVTDYRLTVEDYDGAFASISKTSLILDKPMIDFEYRIGSLSGQVSNYLYSGNVGHESVFVNPLITWNDEAWSSALYNTSGTRTEKWTQLKSLQTTSNKEAYNLILKNNFNNILSGNIINTELEAKNRYDLFNLATKSIENLPVSLQDLTGSEGYINVRGNGHGFMVGETAIFKVRPILGAKGKLEDLKINISSSKPSMNKQDLIYDSSNNIFRLEKPIPESKDDSSLWDFFNYTLNIYSARTGEKLHENTGAALIHTPLNLKGYVEGKDNTAEEIEVSTDTPFTVSATTLKYAEKVTVKFLVEVRDAVTGEIFAAEEEVPMNSNAAHTEWSRKLIIDNSAVTVDELSINADFTAYAYNYQPRQVRGIGHLGDYETDSVGFKVISYKLFDFRIVLVRDIRLEDYYKNSATGKFEDIDKFVNDMAIDARSFAPYPISSLAKGYVFEFEIDSKNFNDDNDTVIFQPSFYSVSGNYRDNSAKAAFWVDSNKQVYTVGSGAHANYNRVILTKQNRVKGSGNTATWRGSYYIPATTFLTNAGTNISSALSNNLKTDIIVYFDIDGLKNGVPKFDYNLKQWGKERTIEKDPYVIGDTIRYSADVNNLDDLKVIRPR
jgi:hypothetical protein